MQGDIAAGYISQDIQDTEERDRRSVSYSSTSYRLSLTPSIIVRLERTPGKSSFGWGGGAYARESSGA